MHYELNKILEKCLKCSSNQYQLKSYYILLSFKHYVNFYTTSIEKWLKKYIVCPIVLYFSFQFKINNSITICRSQKWITLLHLLPASEMDKRYTLALNFGVWSIVITVTSHLKPKSSHSNERVGIKPISRTLLNNELGCFLRPSTPELWKLF